MQEQKRRQAQKGNTNNFCEYVIKDEKGETIKQAEIHKEIQWHIRECYKRSLKCGILAPWGSGKTEQVAIARTLDFIKQDKEIRIFIVCNSDDNAKARVNSVKQYIESDKEYHAVAPDIKPARTEEWTKHRLVVERKSRMKDATVEAWGITSSGIGGRCDVLICDDPVDLRNAILQPALRQQVKDSFRNVWMSRLSPEGFLIYIATIWHQDDLTNELLKNAEYCFLIIKVAEDFSCLECKSPLKGKWTIPLWSAWNSERLKARKREIGESAYNRGFRQVALSSKDMTFPHGEEIFETGKSIQQIVKRDWPRYAGVDPFGQYRVIFTLVVDEKGYKYPIEIVREKCSSGEFKELLIKQYKKHKHQLIKFENNAAQEAMREWMLEDNVDMPLEAFTTGLQKMKPDIGLPGLEVEFENKGWRVLMGEKEHPSDCTCNFCEFKRELLGHPIAGTSDIVMAAWLAREAARAGSAELLTII